MNMRYGSLNALNKLTLQFKTLEDEKAYLKAALQQITISVLLLDCEFFILECISVLCFSLINGIMLPFSWMELIVLVSLAILLLYYKYSKSMVTRQLYLLIQTFNRWKKIVDSTMPINYIITQFEYRTHSIGIFSLNKSVRDMGIKDEESLKQWLESLILADSDSTVKEHIMRKHLQLIDDSAKLKKIFGGSTDSREGFYAKMDDGSRIFRLSMTPIYMADEPLLLIEFEEITMQDRIRRKASQQLSLCSQIFDNLRHVAKRLEHCLQERKQQQQQATFIEAKKISNSFANQLLVLADIPLPLPIAKFKFQHLFDPLTRLYSTFQYTIQEQAYTRELNSNQGLIRYVILSLFSCLEDRKLVNVDVKQHGESECIEVSVKLNGEWQFDLLKRMNLSTNEFTSRKQLSLFSEALKLVGPKELQLTFNASLNMSQIILYFSLDISSRKNSFSNATHAEQQQQVLKAQSQNSPKYTTTNSTNTTTPPPINMNLLSKFSAQAIPQPPPSQLIRKVSFQEERQKQSSSSSKLKLKKRGSGLGSLLFGNQDSSSLKDTWDFCKITEEPGQFEKSPTNIGTYEQIRLTSTPCSLEKDIHSSSPSGIKDDTNLHAKCAVDCNNNNSISKDFDTTASPSFSGPKKIRFTYDLHDNNEVILKKKEEDNNNWEAQKHHENDDILEEDDNVADEKDIRKHGQFGEVYRWEDKQQDCLFQTVKSNATHLSVQLDDRIPDEKILNSNSPQKQLIFMHASPKLQQRRYIHQKSLYLDLKEDYNNSYEYQNYNYHIPYHHQRYISHLDQIRMNTQKAYSSSVSDDNSKEQCQSSCNNSNIRFIDRDNHVMDTTLRNGNSSANTSESQLDEHEGGKTTHQDYSLRTMSPSDSMMAFAIPRLQFCGLVDMPSRGKF